VQVTIVAVLQRLGANEDLYALVFGESCLNDAVGVVLYRTLTLFLHERVTVGSTFAGILSFLGVFLGSMLIGASLTGRLMASSVPRNESPLCTQAAAHPGMCARMHCMVPANAASC